MEGVNRIKKMVNLNEYLNILYRCKHLGNLVDLRIDDRDGLILFNSPILAFEIC